MGHDAGRECAGRTTSPSRAASRYFAGCSISSTRVTHPYTNAAPGGWAWTDLPGGVPDADDTPGAILALVVATMQRTSDVSRGCPEDEIHHGGTDRAIPTSPCLRTSVVNSAVNDAAESGIRWLINLQNRDGGFPTFCRGWGTLPFDRSSPDITAHCLRAYLVSDRSPPNQWNH